MSKYKPNSVRISEVILILIIVVIRCQNHILTLVLFKYFCSDFGKDQFLLSLQFHDNI